MQKGSFILKERNYNIYCNFMRQFSYRDLAEGTIDAMLVAGSDEVEA